MTDVQPSNLGVRFLAWTSGLRRRSWARRGGWAGRCSWNVVAAVFFLPLVVLFVQAVAFRWFFPQVLPQEWRVGLLAEWLGRSEVRSAVQNSALVAFLTTTVSLLVGLPAAWYLATKKVVGRTLWIGLLVAPQLLPPLTAGMGLSIAFTRIGLSAGLVSVVVAHLVPVVPFVVGIASVSFSRLDMGYVQVARGLGWSAVRSWRKVVWPLTRVGVFLAAYVGFVISWSQYLLTLFVGGGQIITLPMLVLSSGSGANVSLFAALALVMSLVPMFLFLFVRKGPVGA